MKIASKIYVFLIFAFLYAPLLIIAFFSFNQTDSTAVFSGFSFRWYRELFRDEETLAALKNTLVLAVISSVVSAVLGTAAAVGISKMKKGFVRKSVMTVTNMPMMNPDIVTGVSMMLLFVLAGGLVNSKNVLGFPTILIAHITFQLPYVILSILPKIKQMDKHLPEAAMDLGCTPVQSFFKVELPAILPGIITGLMMAFTLSMDDFVISYFVSGTSYQTLPIRIFSMTKKRVKPDMYALSTIIFVSVLILLILINLPSKEERMKRKQSNKSRVG
ncbi:MAG: ABC transporter permease [Ruminococcaceae bacterium]|nr:ABC transporter permease [Oscillospiraceae bacterium]